MSTVYWPSCQRALLSPCACRPCDPYSMNLVESARTYAGPGSRRCRHHAFGKGHGVWIAWAACSDNTTSFHLASALRYHHNQKSYIQHIVPLFWILLAPQSDMAGFKRNGSTDRRAPDGRPGTSNPPPQIAQANMARRPRASNHPSQSTQVSRQQGASNPSTHRLRPAASSEWPRRVSVLSILHTCTT
jgi:hypothetical protein